MSDKWIKITSIIALVVFIVVMAMSVMAFGGGLILSGGVEDMLQGSLEYADPDNPGGGWLALGGIFGSFIGGFAAIFLAAMGIVAAVADILLGAPILIGWIIWKKTGNRKAYTVCCIIPVAIISVFAIVSYVINFIGSFSMILM